MEDFCETDHLHTLIKDLLCFKNPDKPSCIDLILTIFRSDVLSEIESYKHCSLYMQQLKKIILKH